LALLGLPPSWRYIRERGIVRHESAPVAHSGLTWQQGLRSFAFWIIVAVLFVSSISMNGAVTHLSAVLTDRGITAGDAALCASLLGGSSLLGRIGLGWLLNRFFGARVAFIVSLMTAGAFFFSPGQIVLLRVVLQPGSLARALAAKRHYALLANSLFRVARSFDALRSHLDILFRRGSHRPGDPRPRI